MILSLFPLMMMSASEVETGRLVILGDSITAGYNLSPQEAYPALLQEKIKASGFNHTVINAGQSGDTTAGGLRRLDWVLGDEKADIVVLALGANDGLRGLSLEAMQENIARMIGKARAANPHTQIVVAGMRMPESMGETYTRQFSESFTKIASSEDVLLLPFLLQGVAGDPQLNQADRIHPNAAGQRRIAENVWPVILPLLQAPPLN